MARQHAKPLLLPSNGGHALPLTPLAEAAAAGTVTEGEIQALVHAHPACLPIAEIDPLFIGPVSICTELATPAGPIDNFMVTPSGLPVLVECKLWRNPEARREVVGQILDYAKELSRWSSSDVQREVTRRLKCAGNPVLELVREVAPLVDEIQFNDDLTYNLRLGRFLLLIVGDGIREGVETISEYLQDHAGLQFSLGLVELPIYAMPDGSRLVAPRVLARTINITRNVVQVPIGYEVQEAKDDTAAEADPERAALAGAQQLFWTEFLNDLRLDDPEQPRPKPARMGWIGFSLPARAGTAWLTVYRDMRLGEVGVALSSSRNSAGEHAMRVIAEEWETIENELGGTARLELDRYGRPRIFDARAFGSLDDPNVRRQAFAWLSERLNTFVNVLRPRVRSAVADYNSSGP